MDAETLRVVHAELLESCGNRVVFHELGDGLHADHMAELVDGFNHGVVHAVAEHILDEAAVDFEKVDRQAFEVGERTQAAAEIIQRE